MYHICPLIKLSFSFFFLDELNLKIQKPLIVTAVRNEATRVREAETELGEHSLVGIAESLPVSDTFKIDHPGRTERGVKVRADVGNVNSTSSHTQANILKIPLFSNFKQQLRDIDAAISGEVPDVNTEPSKEGNVEKEESLLNLNVVRLETKETPHANGLVKEAQS